MDWMAFYNQRRLHSTLGYVSPMQYDNAGTRHSVKRPREPWVKNSTKQGQGQYF